MVIRMVEILNNSSLNESVMMLNIFHHTSIQTTPCEKFWSRFSFKILIV